MHVLFRDKNIPPDEVYNKPKRIRNFMYASLLVAEEELEESKKK